MPDPINTSRVAPSSPPPAEGEAHINVSYRFANVEFDLAHGELRVSGRLVAVEPRPLRLLAVLLQHVNEVVTKEELFDAVWDGRPTVEHVLTNAVSKLRAALGEDGAQRIVTVPRTGYRLAGPLQRVAVRPADFQAEIGQLVPGADGYLLERPLGAAQPPNVWLARHTKLGQVHVFKFASDGPRLASLKREVTLYRVLRHELGPRDDFAQVVGTNFLASPYFLKCEWGGVSLPEWAAAGHLAPLDANARLALFLQIARATAAAHGVGVLHKDLKPGNVLIDDDAASAGETAQGRPRWQLRLTDFGSGRLLDPARLAALGVTALGLTQTQHAGSDSRSGTLVYLAPELIGGHAPTVQSDVYALGVLLYQLLAGDFGRPLATGWARDIADPLLADDIAAATEGRPEKRLASAADLVERLQALEARRREHAERDEAERLASAERAELMQRRARRPWAWGALAALLLGLAVALGFYMRSQQALARAQQQAERAQSINDFLTEDVLQSADVSRLGTGQPATMAEVLRRATAAASERFKGQPRTEASVRLQLGDVFSRLADAAAAEAEYRRAIELLAPMAAPDDVQLLTARLSLTHLLALRTQLDAAQAQLEMAEKALTPALLRANPELEHATQAARIAYLSTRQRYPQAVAPAERLVALADELPLGDGVQRTSRRFLARYTLAEAYMRAGRLKESEALYAAILRPPYSAETVGAVQFDRTRIDLARVRLALGLADGVEGELIAARDALQRRLGTEEPHAATANMELGNVYLQRAEFERAAVAFRAAHSSYLAAGGAAQTNTRISALNLAITDLLAGRAAAALPVLTRERPQFVRDAGAEDNPVVQAIDFYRARAFNDLQRGHEALPVLATLKPQKLTEGEPALDWEWRLQAERGRALVSTGQRQQGAALLHTAIERMAVLKSPEWLLAGYRRQLEQAGLGKP